MSEEKFEFREGDIVGHVQYDGEFVLEKNRDSECVFHIDVRSRRQYFFNDGRVSTTHDKPSIFLIRRPSKKVKKTFWFKSWEYNEELRILSNGFLDKEYIENQFLEHKDVQLHSIEIEVDDE